MLTDGRGFGFLDLYGDAPQSYTTLDLKLTRGNVYEVVVFQAERWCCGLNYMSTLANSLTGASKLMIRTTEAVEAVRWIVKKVPAAATELSRRTAVRSATMESLARTAMPYAFS